MPISLPTTRCHQVLAALCLSVAALATTGASAGSCPKDKVLTQPREIRDAPDVGIGRETLSTVDLSGWRKVENLMLRTRRLTVAVDGIVPTHNHDDRPSIVYVVKGEIIEHSALCSVPILHREGEWASEFGPGHSHWWENKSGKEVVLTSSDVVPGEMMNDPHM
jgi:quercetin dioxygenase-like cupin family protein